MSIPNFDIFDIYNNIYIEDLENGGERPAISCGDTAEINNSDHPNPVMEYRIRIFNKETNKS